MLSDRTLNDPPWVVEIDGVKFATPEPVVLLLKEVSEERDALEAQNEGYGQLLGSANNDVARLNEYLEFEISLKLEAIVKLTHLEAQLAASEKERDKWRNYKPDNEELEECRKQALSRDGTYTNGLAAGHVYMVALEAVIRQRDTRVAALREATDALPAWAAEQFGWGQRLNFGPEQQGYKICDMLIEYSELLESLDD